MEKLEHLLGPATLIVRSGGIWTNPATGEQEDKLHAHWRLKTPARGKDDLTKLKRARELSTALVGGDPTNVPVCHPIRWPGSWHKKSAPRLCEIVSTDLDREIYLDTALVALEKAAPQKKTNGQAGPQQSGSDQESKDWNELVGNVVRGEELHFSLTRLAMKLLRAEITDAAAVRHLRALLCVSQAERDDRWQQRIDYIPRAVSTARAKIGDDKDKDDTPPPPLPFLDLTQWQHITPPPRAWVVLDRIPLNNVTLLSGESAVGKTILGLQLCVATALGRDWISRMLEPGPVIAVCCEDDDGELHRRLDPIVRHYQAGYTDLGELKPISLAGKDALLATPRRDGLLEPTTLLKQFHQAARDIKPKLIMLDNSADLYGGNENDRAQVRQFIGMLRGLAMAGGSGVLLVASILDRHKQ